jgi:imidazolonepropionase-like amidohydrolase
MTKTVRPAPAARRLALYLLAVVFPACLAAAPQAANGASAPAPAGSQEAAADVAAARALFEQNLDAIRRKDRDAYLACYEHSPSLARTGPTGPALGFEEFAKTAGEAWPDSFEAQDLRLTPVQPGIVYGTYRYRVRYGNVEDAGISERFFVKRPEGWKIAVTTAFSAPPGTPPPPRALVGATLVDGTGAPPVADAVVLLRDGKVECAGPRAACPVPADAGVVDLAGQWITPGLIDTHIHLSQTGWVDGRPDAIDARARHPYDKLQAELRRNPERFLHSYLCSGVTAVFDVGGFAWTLEVPALAEPRTDLPHVAAAGPLLATIDHWLNLPAERQFIHITDADAARAGVRYLAALRADAVKVWFIVEEGADVAQLAVPVAAAGEEAKAQGLPLIVHATGLAEAKAALKAGARLLVHSVWDVPVDQEFLDLARANGAIYCPTLTVRRGYLTLFRAAANGTAPAADDPNGCVDPATRAKLAETATLGSQGLDAAALERRETRTAEGERLAAENLKRVADAGIKIAMGTDAGNPLTLHGPAVYVEMEAMQAAGLTPMQVLVASTRDAAEAMGKAELFGTVTKGKAADLLVVGADPTVDVKNYRQVRYVVRGGVLRPLADLQAMAAGPPPEAPK